MSKPASTPFIHTLINDLGAAAMLPNIMLGEEMGLYRAMADGQPVTAQTLATRTGCNARLLREWLNAHAASGYMQHNDEHFSLDEQQAQALAHEDSATYIAGGTQAIASMVLDKDKLVAAMRGDGGLAWGDHHACMFGGVERLFRPGYRNHLVGSWLPALEGVVDKLHAGARVADIGCGLGTSTLLMAEAFAASHFDGIDYHAPSVATAGQRARDSGLTERVRFTQASAKDYPGRDYDLVCFFDCLHDLGDPVGAARHAWQALKPGGTLLLVEPFSNDRLDDNLNPVGRLFYAVSTFLCTPNSLSQEVGLGLGAQAGEARIRGVLEEAGFSHMRRACETPFNLILEARK